MLHAPPRTRYQFTERSRFYLASYLVGLARFTLWTAQHLFRIGLLDVSGVRLFVRISERLRRLGWRLIRGRRARPLATNMLPTAGHKAAVDMTQSDGLPCLDCPACGRQFGLAAGTGVLLAERLPDPFIATCPSCARQSSYFKEAIRIITVPIRGDSRD